MGVAGRDVAQPRGPFWPGVRYPVLGPGGGAAVCLQHVVGDESPEIVGATGDRCMGDERGLRLPPKVAPVQVIVVPIWRTEAEQTLVEEAVGRVMERLTAAGTSQ